MKLTKTMRLLIAIPPFALLIGAALGAIVQASIWTRSIKSLGLGLTVYMTAYLLIFSYTIIAIWLLSKWVWPGRSALSAAQKEG